MNHKRKRPKNARAGCLLCKPHKANGAKHVDKPSLEAKLAAMRKEVENGYYDKDKPDA